jgi:hypothetical protein
MLMSRGIVLTVVASMDGKFFLNKNSRFCHKSIAELIILLMDEEVFFTKPH